MAGDVSCLAEMEQEPDNGEPAEIKILKEAYEKAFLFVNKGLNTDELGQKEEAKNYYKQGIGHLLRGISIMAAEPGCTGPAWESARQMQQKMKETLQNVRTRLEILEKGLATSLRNDLQDVPKLYPEFPPKDTCKKSPEPDSDSSAPQHAEVDGSASAAGAASAGPSAALSAGPLPSCPTEAPPAYTLQAAEGHYTVSYGTDSGEFSSVGEDFYRNHSQPPPLETLGLDADELILIPNGVQIFFVNPAGEVSAPSYPGYLRIVRFLDNSLDTVLNRPPGFLQVSSLKQRASISQETGRLSHFLLLLLMFVPHRVRAKGNAFLLSSDTSMFSLLGFLLFLMLESWFGFYLWLVLGPKRDFFF